MVEETIVVVLERKEMKGRLNEIEIEKENEGNEWRAPLLGGIFIFVEDGEGAKTYFGTC